MATFIHATGSRKAGTRVFRVYGAWGERRFPEIRSKSELYDKLIDEIGLPRTASRWEVVNRLMDLNYDKDRAEWIPDFGGQVMRARTKAGLTQTELAQKIGLTQPMIQMLEDGTRRPSFDTVRSLSSVLGVELKVTLAAPKGAEQPVETKEVK